MGGGPAGQGGVKRASAGAIPATPEDFPNELRYDAPTRRLFIGKGYVENGLTQLTK